ncbi:hypothetical protein BDV93DRAFT_276185 [Ceratobasidium sp. AG-I]|nr:hypothetical protein BDV93DRAFT_276185 [Ceratobasidium sp. AG-I]
MKLQTNQTGKDPWLTAKLESKLVQHAALTIMWGRYMFPPPSLEYPLGLALIVLICLPCVCMASHLRRRSCKLQALKRPKVQRDH